MKYYVVDAFAEKKVFEGNPAGVCIMEEWISDDLMQKKLQLRITSQKLLLQ